MSLDDEFKSQLSRIAINLRHFNSIAYKNEESITCNSQIGLKYVIKSEFFEPMINTYSLNLVKHYGEKIFYKGNRK